MMASRAVEVVRQHLETEPLTVFLDAGSSCYFLAKALAHEIERDGLFRTNGNKLAIITNSPPALSVLSETISRLPEETQNRVHLHCLGGQLRVNTRAITAGEDAVRNCLKEVDDGLKNRRVAFIGASVITPTDICTRHKEETSVKRGFIASATDVYILADHSKANVLLATKAESFYSRNESENPAAVIRLLDERWPHETWLAASLPGD